MMKKSSTLFFRLGFGVFVIAMFSCQSSTNDSALVDGPGTTAHPFMYLTEDRRAVIETSIQTEPMASIYATVLETAAKELSEIDQQDWDAKAHGDNGEIAVANAFLAWLNDDEQAAQRALDIMATLTTNWDDHTGWGINIRMPSPLIHYTAAWDFLMATDFMSEAQAQVIEMKLTTVTDQFFKYYVLDDTTRQLALTVTQNNHPIRTAAAIGFVALAFPGHPDASIWLDWAVSELAYLLGEDGQYIQGDGAVSEGPFYFNYGLAPTLPFYIALDNRAHKERQYTRNCINRSDEDPWRGHGCVEGESFTFTNPMGSELFRRALDWSLALRLPDGSRAPIGDSPLRSQVGQALFTHFGGPDYLYWDWATNPSNPHRVKGGFELAISHLAYVEPPAETNPPQWTNRFFIDGGMATFRSGWDNDDRVLILMGESGAARKTVHDHPDGTSFVLAAYDELLLTDTGYYKPNSLQNPVTAVPGSHNLILIDGEGAPAKGLLTDWGDADAFIKNTVDGRALAYAESHQNYQGTDVVRGVAFVRGRYFVMADQLSSNVEVEREYRFRLHAFAGRDLDGSVSLDEFGPHIQKERGSVAVYTTSSQGACQLVEPDFEAFASPHVHKLEKDAEHHTVTDSVITGRAPDFLTVLAPYRTATDAGPDAPLDVSSIETDKGAAWQIIGSDTLDIAWVREDDAPEHLTLPSGQVITTDAAFILWSADNSLGLMVRGTELRVDGTLLISASTGEHVKTVE
ncbi:MAG: heparinase II/III family protein [Myxococcota bacterium]|nr:heparinase II/III family protein [Myxococcota bacterium]